MDIFRVTEEIMEIHDLIVDMSFQREELVCAVMTR